MTKRSLCSLLAVLFLLFCLGCAYHKNTPTTSGGYTVTDDTGRKVKLPSKPHRIVSLTYGTDEMLFALVKPERIAAISKWSDYPEISFLSKTETSQVTNRVEPNTESIMQYKPGLVLVSVSTGMDAAHILEDMGIPVYVTSSPKSIQELQEKILGVAKVVGEEPQGKYVIEQMNKRLSVLEEKLHTITAEKQKVCVAFGFTGAIGRKGYLMDNMMRLAHLRNGSAEAGLEQGNVISKEQVIAKNPDVIFLPAWNFGHTEDDSGRYKKEFMQDPAWQTVTAVQDKEVFIMPERYRYAASQHIVEGIEAYASMAYPELFKKEE